MMAKKLLQKTVKAAPNPSKSFRIGKVVATTGGKTKAVPKVKGKPVTAKKANPFVKTKTVKK